jgi:uracil phosphoribosyltransferase
MASAPIPPRLTDYKAPAQVKLLQRSPQLIALLTCLRSADTPRGDFIHTADRIIRLLVEEALNHLPFNPVTVTTPIGATYNGLIPQGGICGVSIMRAGESMETALRECCRAVRIGKILIQRNEETKQPHVKSLTVPMHQLS